MNASLNQEITDIAIGQRIAAVPAHRHQNDLFGKSMPLERIARHFLIYKKIGERKRSSKQRLNATIPSRWPLTMSNRESRDKSEPNIAGNRCRFISKASQHYFRRLLPQLQMRYMH